MFGVVGLLAVCCLTFVNASRLLSQIVFTATIATLLAVLLGSIVKKGHAWSGAALFGWGYFILVYSDVFRLNSNFVTSHLMSDLFQTMYPNNQPRPGTATPDPSIAEFWRLGHAYSALLFATFGWFPGDYFQPHAPGDETR